MKDTATVIQPIHARIRLSRLGCGEIESDKFYTSFRYQGFFYKVDNKHVTEYATIEEIISNTHQH